MFLEIPNGFFFFPLRDAFLPSVPSDLSRWSFSSIWCSRSLARSQRLSRGWGRKRGDTRDTQDLASSTSSQKDRSSWAAGKALRQGQGALGRQTGTEADGREPGTRVCVGSDPGSAEVWVWRYRARGIEKGL